MSARRVPNERAGQARRECPEYVPVRVPNVSRMSVASVPDRVPSPFGTPHTHHRCACPESSPDDGDGWGHLTDGRSKRKTGGPTISLPGKEKVAGVTTSTAPLRRCARCREPKPLDAFRRDSRGYVRSHCRPCCLADSQEWRARHHAQLLDRRRAQRAADAVARAKRADR
jgi:hypothetical protein